MGGGARNFRSCNHKNTGQEAPQENTWDILQKYCRSCMAAQAFMRHTASSWLAHLDQSEGNGKLVAGQFHSHPP
jgi:hypothetical protein